MADILPERVSDVTLKSTAAIWYSLFRFDSGFTSKRKWRWKR